MVFLKDNGRKKVNRLPLADYKNIANMHVYLNTCLCLWSPKEHENCMIYVAIEPDMIRRDRARKGEWRGADSRDRTRTLSYWGSL
jgi:hypothetical protein